jgi:DNA-binding response OmpR family regulator
MVETRVPHEFRLLGPVEAWRGGRRVDLGGPKQRAVLAALLLRAGRVVPLETLIDDVWPDAPPARAAATVQVFVSQLRRALEPDRPRGAPPELLRTVSRGYLLDVPRSAVDAHVFTRLADEGRAALVDDPAHATEVLGRAAELWRGRALADLTAFPFARTEAARLDELGLTAAEDRTDAELALGRHAGAVADLERRVRRHPLRERGRAQLMLALYRCGRAADALETYRDGRRALCDELGLEPGPALRELEQAVLRQDPALDRPAPVLRPLPAGQEVEAPGRVLVVDDSGVNRRLLGAALAEQGHEVHTAENGRRALELLRGGVRFDLVLLDLLMPVLDGYATLTEIKADPALEHLPVIMVSAVPELESVVRCIELGATDYLPKPFSATVLRARLRSSLAAKRRHDTERDSLAALRAEIAALRSEVDRARATAS